MLHMIRASREGNWMLHLACIRQMLPWCFAYDNTNYARYMSIYDQPTKEHPQVHAFMEAGGFSVQMSPNNAFGRIPVDQTIEETINKDSQRAGGRFQSESWCTPAILHDRRVQGDVSAGDA